MGLFDRFRKIKYKLILLTSGVVFVSVTILSYIVFQQFRTVLLEKTISVCANLSTNISNFAKEELLINEIFDGTRNAINLMRKNRVEGLRNTYVINLDGRIVAHTAADMVGKRANAEDLKFYSRLWKLAFTEINLEGRPTLRFAYPIFIVYRNEPLRVGTGVFEFDKNEIYKPVDDMLNYVVVTSLILIISIVLLTLYLSTRLSRPIEEVAHTASIIAQGNLGTQVKVDAGGEIGQLAQRINDMSAKLLEAEERRREMEDIKVQQAAIGRELEIAHGIQIAVLPLNQEIGPYSFLGFMETADEVGGDYYDCIRIKQDKQEHYWFFIGDVSGHGLQSGLTMLMAQTAIQSIMEVGKNLDPASAFVSVNRVLYANLNRLRENKYMTASFYRADARGNFLMAGLHLDTLVHRAKTGEVEIIPSDGMWLGIEEDVDQWINNGKFKLSKDDTILLYTDGITEAVDRRGGMFDDERLIESFRKYGDLSLDQIQHNLLDDLLAHMDGAERRDDITFALIRRN